MRPPYLAISAQSATNAARPTRQARASSSQSGAWASKLALTGTAASAVIHATLILKVPAYFFASLPSHTTPSISLAVRKESLGSGVPVASAACL